LNLTGHKAEDDVVVVEEKLSRRARRKAEAKV
jgi:hypothetical protein